MKRPARTAGAVVAVDVGNTATSAALFVGAPGKPLPRPRHVWTVSTPLLLGAGRFGRFLKGRLRAAGCAPADVIGVAVSSVVPAVDATLRGDLRRLFSPPPLFVSAANAGRVRIRYAAPREVGADRIVNARAALALGSRPAIVIDFGTATTFDCVSARGEYLGGVIAPGPLISAEALYARTAKLPLATLDKPAAALGRNTLESIRSGLYHGYRGLVKEIVAQLRRRLGSRTRVLATGGQAKWILSGVSGIDAYVPTLTLAGLRLLWDDAENRPEKSR